MKVICPISGVELIKSDLFLGEDYTEVHPIFRVDRSKFITPTLIHRFTRAVNTQEKKLYFLATMNSTDLVSFHCVANPTLRTVEVNFLDMVKIAGWIDYAYFTVAREISFPKYSVRTDNADLSNVGVWLASLNDIREDFIKKDNDRERAFRLSQQHARMEKEFQSAHVKDRFFTPVVARWALEFAQLDDHPKYDRFYTTLVTTDADSWGLDKGLIDELRSLFNDRLDMRHPLASTIFGQIARLKQSAITKSETFSFQSIGEVIIDASGVERVEQRPVSQVYREKMLREYGGLTEPKQEDFNDPKKSPKDNRFDYIRARATWKLATTPDEPKPEQRIIKANPDVEDDPIADDVADHFKEEQLKIDEPSEPPEDPDEEEGDTDADII